jgi:predicted nucleic acid-binding protein
LSLYLDTSVLVAALTLDPLSDRAAELLSHVPDELLVSDFVGAEYASAVARRVRMGDLTRSEGHAAFAALDDWCSALTSPVTIASADIAAASQIIRSLDVSLRAPDAVNLAMARRLGATLATFDRGLQRAAETLGIPVLS